ncbi:MAG: pseudouridine synthase [Clostridium perfringens]|nr:pseudouridine synthase [Clostridium perfringens]
MERLDKVLSNLGYGTRKEIKQVVKKGFVTVNDEKVKDSGLQIDPEKDVIVINGEKVEYKKYIYLMMNKPAGVISATYDKRDETVIDLLYMEDQVFEPFPVGRLDKDTVGLLLLTNDGDLNHKLISPKYHVDKVYYAEINAPITEKDIKAFENGVTLDDGYKCMSAVTLDDGYKCMSAKLKVIENLEDSSRVEVTVQEGKYHQVKRMFEARGKKVVYLKRTSFGNLPLDESLEEGEYKELSESELAVLYKNF